MSGTEEGGPSGASRALSIPSADQYVARRVGGTRFRPRERNQNEPNTIWPNVDCLAFLPVNCKSTDQGLGIIPVSLPLPFYDSADKTVQTPNYSALDRSIWGKQLSEIVTLNMPYLFYDPKTNQIVEGQPDWLSWDNPENLPPLALYWTDINKHQRLSHTIGPQMLVFHSGVNPQKPRAERAINALLRKPDFKSLVGLTTFASALIPHADQLRAGRSFDIPPDQIRSALGKHFANDAELEKERVPSEYLSTQFNNINWPPMLNGVYL